MKKFLLGMLGAALAGGMAYAQQEEPMDPTQDPTQEQTPEYGEEVGEWGEQDPMSETEDPTQSEMDDPTMSETQQEESTTEEPATSTDELYGQESGMQQHDLSSMSAEDLKGMTIVSDTGEEIGSIDRVGEVRVVTVDVGGFLGVGAKTVAIPISELEMSSDGNLQTTLTRETLEQRQEFDEQAFTEESSESEDTSY
jgi:PRC-barrel domain